MQIERVQQLSAWLAATDIGLLELRGPEGCLRLHNDGGRVEVLPDAPVAPGIRRAEAARIVATAASVGVFLQGHPLRDAPLAPIGARVRAGQALGLLQIGALLLPATASQDGIVAGLLVAQGMLVGYGTPLIELQPLD